MTEGQLHDEVLELWPIVHDLQRRFNQVVDLLREISLLQGRLIEAIINKQTL